jgi:hypothetical protein
MRKKGLKRLLALGLSLCVCFSTSVHAEEANQIKVECTQEGDAAQDVSLEEVSEDKLSDLYEEIVRVEDAPEYVPNKMERSYDGTEYSVTNVLGGPAAYAADDNTDPNNAYLAVNGNTVQGTLTQTGEARWYGFILEQTSKISIMVQTYTDVDADLYVFKLNQETGELIFIGGSLSEGMGVQEYCGGIVDAGIYYFAITACEGSGAYAFAYFASQDMNYEPNDTLSTAATVGVNSTVTGIIDTPFDMDYYKFTLESPVIMNISVDVGEYQFDVLSVDENANMYKISTKENLYRLDAGTHYFRVYSTEHTYDSSKTYTLTFNKIANISNDPASTLFMVNESAKIVFQCDVDGGHMYVNGNEIDISYYYARNYSTSAGTRNYSISLLNVDSLRAVIYSKDAVDLNIQLDPTYIPKHGNPILITNAQIGMPGVIFYRSGSTGTGEKDINVLQLSLVSDGENDDDFYILNCNCTGAYIDEYMNTSLNWGTVYINPDTGKVVDIYFFNYFYDFIRGSANKLHFLTYDMKNCKYLYPYLNGKEPKEW